MWRLTNVFHLGLTELTCELGHTCLVLVAGDPNNSHLGWPLTVIGPDYRNLTSLTPNCPKCGQHLPADVEYHH